MTLKQNVKKFFSQCEFLFGAHNFSQIQDFRFPEVAFVGVSNVGKSSLINAVVGQKIAITSSNPGCTKQLNFFKIGERLIIADMPGYGYAKASKKDVSHWQKTVFEYLTKRRNLKRVFLLINSERGIRESDIDIINIFNTLAVSFQIILTKFDKLSTLEQELVMEKTKDEMKNWAACYPEILATSSLAGSTFGISKIQEYLYAL